MESEKILIAESDPRVAELASIKLSNAGYLVLIAHDGKSALEKAEDNSIDLFLIGINLPEKCGYEVCHELRIHSRYRNTPLIMMIDSTFDEEQFKVAQVKVDDFLTKPFTPKNLLNTVNSNMVNFRLLRQINPITLLPGKTHLMNCIHEIIENKKQFDLIFSDLKDFKSYNQSYGFERGNEVIDWLSQLIQEEIGKPEMSGASLYHLGGDDFCILLNLGCAEKLCENIINRFDREILSFYSEADQQRRGMVLTNRRKMVEQYPLMTIDLGIVSNEKRVISNWLQAEMIGIELLKYGKTIPGSRWVKDRRQS